MCTQVSHVHLWLPSVEFPGSWNRSPPHSARRTEKESLTWHFGRRLPCGTTDLASPLGSL